MRNLLFVVISHCVNFPRGAGEPRGSAPGTMGTGVFYPHGAGGLGPRDGAGAGARGVFAPWGTVVTRKQIKKI